MLFMEAKSIDGVLLKLHKGIPKILTFPERETSARQGPLFQFVSGWCNKNSGEIKIAVQGGMG